ncbi:GspE/PulE family protein [Aequorivita sp. CIP111184]|uniref:GspE/PulE family protein n=1 Tax=Aequorivita sp. CIP111184 TaxID=2211356 RepID=UPI000DBBEE8A|nr:GspE/PulE family protein [Aequorivita sp. CIP111184]SRX52228.1 Putative type II secretion system protein E [Aequorivita sp. CIP111184]
MKQFEIPVALKQLITPNQAFHYRIVPIEEKEGVVILKTDNPQIQTLAQELEVLLNFKISLVSESIENIQSYLTYNYRQATEETKELHASNFLERLLQTAKDFNSSDIHLETYEEYCRVRFRLDGKLKEQYTIPMMEYPQLINQIKIQAGLDISQKRLSQDGRISVKAVSEDFDIRVSTMPTLYGEKVVLRILKRDAQAVELEQLGFNPRELKLYMEGVKMPNGIVLISGPTGSGKTTTLYGTLKLLNKEETNILTIEDPIEYTLDGINQVQLKEDIGFDFPTALRTFLRQDPDIIMVGEIRDEKTANMAIKAALTGHLVLSTIHTNSAWATISRLIDMGVPPYLLATTLNMSVAQRLVRKLCSQCKKETVVSEDLFPESFTDTSTIKKHYAAVGCNHCYYTGYDGRKAVYEIIPINKELETAIKHNELQIDDYLANHNLNTLKTNAIEMINKGETSIDEAYSLLAN